MYNHISSSKLLSMTKREGQLYFSTKPTE